MGGVNPLEHREGPAAHQSDGSAQDFSVRLAEVLLRDGPRLVRTLLSYRRQLRLEDAEDLLASAVAEAWLVRDRFDPARSLTAWVWGILLRLTSKALHSGWLKHRGAEINMSSEFLDVQTPSSPDSELYLEGEDSENHAAPSPTAAAVVEIVGRLPQHQRRIVRADAEAEDSTENSRVLGKQLGLSAVAVRVHRLRARRTVEAELERRWLPIPGQTAQR